MPRRTISGWRANIGLRDAFAGPQAAEDRQRDAEVIPHQAREGVEGLFILGRVDRVAHEAAGELRERGARVVAVNALGPQRRRCLRNAKVASSARRLARGDQQAKRARPRRSRTGRRGCRRPRRRRRRRRPDRRSSLISARCCASGIGRAGSIAAHGSSLQVADAAWRAGSSRACAFPSSQASSPAVAPGPRTGCAGRGARRIEVHDARRCRPSPAIAAARLLATMLLPTPGWAEPTAMIRGGAARPGAACQRPEDMTGPAAGCERVATAVERRSGPDRSLLFGHSSGFPLSFSSSDEVFA